MLYSDITLALKRTLLGKLHEPRMGVLGNEEGGVEVTGWRPRPPHELGVTLVVGDGFPPTGIIVDHVVMRRYELSTHPYELWAGYDPMKRMWYVRHDLALHW